MRKLLITTIAFSLVAFGAGSASALCDFNAPAKAKGGKDTFVRAMAGCGGGSFADPNVETAGGVPGCQPPQALSAYTFGPKGACMAKTKTVYEAPCRFTGDSSCSNVYISAKCKDVRSADGTTPIFSPGAGDGWAFSNVSRATMADSSVGDLTAIDFPSQFTFPGAKKGGLKVKGDANQMLFDLLQLSTGLPPCISIESVVMTVKDPDGNSFAVRGSAARGPVVD